MTVIDPRLKHMADDYLAWLREQIRVEEITGPSSGWAAITTPYLDRHNDFIEIYVKESNGGYILSDDGNTMEDLEQSGCLINTDKRRAFFHQALTSYGIVENDHVLTATSSKEQLPFKKHMFIQGILTIGDMFMMASPTVASLFAEDVEKWMENQGIRFVSRLKFTGRSGYDHVFDFAIPKSTQSPERLIRAFTRPSRDRAQAMAFSWIDTREVRARDTEAYAILNDVEQAVPAAVIGALKAYQVTPVPWTERDLYRDRLAA